MVGQGSIDHLDRLLLQQYNDSSLEYFREALLLPKDNDTDEDEYYKTRDDVFVKYGAAHGNLTVNRHTGYATHKCFGPELMFGWTLGDVLFGENGKILLIKTAWGGQSLKVGFRPPSSGDVNITTIDLQPNRADNFGRYYRMMVQDIRETLEHFADYVPGHQNDDGYTLEGLVWF